MNFAEVEREVAKLRQDLAAGRLTEDECKARMRELMVQDEEGNWWMVGYETGQWHRHDGTDWVRADPPGHVVQKPPPPPTTLPKPTRQPVAWLVERVALITKSRSFRGIAVLLLGLVLTFGVGVGVGWWAYEASYRDIMPVSCASPIWLGGLILTIVITRKVWRGK